MRTRYLAPLPADHSIAQLLVLTQSTLSPRAVVNVVHQDGGDWLAAYVDDSETVDAPTWSASVAAHVPSHPTPEEQVNIEAANEASLFVELDPDAATPSPTINAIRIGANGTGVFATNAARDAVIRSLCRAQLLQLRLHLRRLGSTAP